MIDAVSVDKGIREEGRRRREPERCRRRRRIDADPLLPGSGAILDNGCCRARRQRDDEAIIMVMAITDLQLLRLQQQVALSERRRHPARCCPQYTFQQYPFQRLSIQQMNPTNTLADPAAPE